MNTKADLISFTIQSILIIIWDIYTWKDSFLDYAILIIMIAYILLACKYFKRHRK